MNRGNFLLANSRTAFAMPLAWIALPDVRGDGDFKEATETSRYAFLVGSNGKHYRYGTDPDDVKRRSALPTSREALLMMR
jgi:hypothetical protein